MKTLWHGGKIYTMVSEGETIEAVLVSDGKIEKIGTYNELKELADKEMHLDGKIMYPGFVDSHMHMIGHGEKLLRVDLSKIESSEEMKEQLIRSTKDLAPESWFIGEGWNENNFPDRKIFHRLELDEISESPMMLKRVCRHAVLANSSALQLAGITKDTPDPEGGVIVRDNDGEPTGYLLDAAQDLVADQIPEVSVEYLTHALKTSVENLLSLGLTGAHTEDMGYYGHDYTKPLQAFKNVIGSDKLKFRANLLRAHSQFEAMMEHASYAEPFIDPGAMKIFADGSIGGKTALLSKPYNDDPSTSGVAIHSDEELHRLVAMARKHGEAIAIHVIGDLAMEKALDAIEAHPVAEGKRDRLIHAMILREDLVERMEKLAVILDLQPSFVSSDFPWVIERLGEERIKWSYAWKSLVDRGLICAGGSDAPIEEVDPLQGIYAAVARRKPYETHEGYMPQEKLSRFEAIQLYTSGSAAAICKEQERGIIAENFDADFSVFDRDLFEGELEQIIEAEVELTVVAGDIMYQKGRSE
ncbi:N-substituted formamide deformylase precursor [Planococcus massiliensis]|uniref:N-substituted formamide deformylase n=1 Tax=Planococcus massiliensis TaxID=1499687 RepID=A0A098EK33_9BACL|nr:amidohydrolase [Planococcus massiliensis]CEG22653.1 N-substituted formamide deformylase precursor [Planococcus massiliensis]